MQSQVNLTTSRGGLNDQDALYSFPYDLVERGRTSKENWPATKLGQRITSELADLTDLFQGKQAYARLVGSIARSIADCFNQIF